MHSLGEVGIYHFTWGPKSPSFRDDMDAYIATLFRGGVNYHIQAKIVLVSLWFKANNPYSVDFLIILEWDVVWCGFKKGIIKTCGYKRLECLLT